MVVALLAVPCAGVLMAWSIVRVPNVAGHAGHALAALTCSTALTRAAPWNAVCFRSQIPARVLNSSPFTVIDPRAVVRSVTGLALSGIYVAYLGSDDPNVGHPLGPLMMADYVFGQAPPRSGNPHRSRTYLTVWEDSYMHIQHGGTLSGPGWYDDQVVFPRRRLEMMVTTDGPQSWATTVAHALSHAIRMAPSRPPPPLRLYVRAPGPHVSVGQAVSFFVLNNTEAAKKPAAFELRVQGGWSKPRVLAPYDGQACGGDNIPALSGRSRTLWNLDFGDCREVSIVLTPTQPGPHSIVIQTYQLATDRSGTVIAGQRHLVPNGGFAWTGAAS